MTRFSRICIPNVSMVGHSQPQVSWYQGWEDNSHQRPQPRQVQAVPWGALCTWGSGLSTQSWGGCGANRVWAPWGWRDTARGVPWCDTHPTELGHCLWAGTGHQWDTHPSRAWTVPLGRDRNQGNSSGCDTHSSRAQSQGTALVGVGRELRALMGHPSQQSLWAGTRLRALMGHPSQQSQGTALVWAGRGQREGMKSYSWVALGSSGENFIRNSAQIWSFHTGATCINQLNARDKNNPLKLLKTITIVKVYRITNLIFLKKMNPSICTN